MTQFKADRLPLLIGSLPMDDHEKATELILRNTQRIPLWAQLPVFKAEGMVEQFLPGLPGLSRSEDGTPFINTTDPGFDSDYLEFFEEYLRVAETGKELENSRFAFTRETGRGFREFLKQIDGSDLSFAALKGQVTGPITFSTSVKDQDKRAIFYNDQLRDASVKHLAMNARYQALEFRKRRLTPLIFFDEPGLAGFGSSALITITKTDVTEAINEMAAAVHAEKGLAGVHVCANTEWDLLLNTNIDIISFDAYSYFDRFILYPETIKTFMERGGILALGIVPTADVDDIRNESVDSLYKRLKDQMICLEKIGIQRRTVLENILITPSCGTGSIDLESAQKVISLTVGLSEKVRD